MNHSNLTNSDFLQLRIYERNERRGAQRAAGRAGWMVLGSIGLMMAVQFLLVAALYAAGAAEGAHSTLLEYLSSCIGYLFLALIPMIYVMTGEESVERLLPFSRPQKVGLTRADVLLLCVVGMMLTLASNWPTQAVQAFLQAVGLSGNIPDMPLDKSFSTQAFYMIYSTVIPPLVEEILFRGAVLGSLRRWGDWFAILVSSILFGLYHGNAGQFVFATLVGLVFGYLRVRTDNMLPGMLLHMLNNGLATLASVLGQSFGSQVSNVFSITYFAVVFAAGLALVLVRLVRQGPESFAKLWVPVQRMASTLGGRMRGLVTSAGGVLMLVYGIGFSIFYMVRS